MRKGAFTFYGFLATTALLLALLWAKHGAWMSQPNQFLLGATGDGLKNTFTTMWHIRHDENMVRYTGMNAPFGEHVLFTDCQPLFANTLRWIDHHLLDISGREIGLLNLLVLLGQLACGVFIYLIFRRLHLPTWFAVLAATGITLLAPQQMRLTAGHLSLANLWVIPMLLWLLIQYEERGWRRPWSFAIGLLVIGAGMIHFYFFGVAGLFLTAYQGYQWLIKRTFRHFRKRLAHWIVMVLLPFGILHFWLNLGHSVIDRPETPFGFNDYRAMPGGVFAPDWLPAIQNLGKTSPLDFENRSYLGLLAVLFTGWLLVRRFQFFEKSWETERFHLRQKRFLKGICFAGLACLIFSLGFPFALPGGEKLLEWAGPLRQFRGTGRFAWPWFFVANGLFFYVIWQISRRWKEAWLRNLTIGAAFGILFIEAFLVQKRVDLHAKPNFFIEKSENQPAWLTAKIDWTRFQGLVPLPFYHTGSEAFSMFCNPSIFEKTQRIAFANGLPDFGSNLSRTSLAQTIKSVQLVTAPLEMPAIFDDLRNEKPLAILSIIERREKNRLEFGHLFARTRPVFRNDELEILELSIDSLRKTVVAERQKVVAEMASAKLFPITKHWKSTNSAAPGFFSAGWELNPADRIFQGSGSFVAPPGGDTAMLFRMPMPAGKFMFSVWQFVGDDQAWTAWGLVSEKNEVGQLLQNRAFMMREETRAIVGEWALYEFEFEVKLAGSLVSWQVLPMKTNRRPLFFDELMIRPAGCDVFRQADGWVVKNNYWHKN